MLDKVTKRKRKRPLNINYSFIETKKETHKKSDVKEEEEERNYHRRFLFLRQQQQHSTAIIVIDNNSIEQESCYMKTFEISLRKFQ